MKQLLIFIIFFAGCKISNAPSNDQSHKNKTAFDRLAIANEMEDWMKKVCLDPWYPENIDSTYGGFYSDFNYQWELDGKQNKMIVSQARHIWSLSTAAEFYNRDPTFIDLAGHGFQFLQSKMWDSDHGGFYQLLNQNGDPIADDPQHGIVKTAYGNAFGVYGLAAYHRVSKNPGALDLAKKAFMWLEEHSHDPAKGGYFQFLHRDGTPLTEGHTNPAKDQNSSIHLLEAFTELYRVWPNELVKKRVREMLVLIRDTITTDEGYLTLFLDKDWNPASYRDSSEAVIWKHIHTDHVSFGHDIETAYLLMEASHIIHDSEDAITQKKAKKMTDHTVRTGWDEEFGGIFDGGYYFTEKAGMTIVLEGKAWWSQVEAMNTLLIMSDLYPDDDIDYAAYFLKSWDYIKKYIIDKEYFGIYRAGIDKTPEAKTGNKAGIWKTNYHTLRSLLNCVRRLRHSE